MNKKGSALALLFLIDASGFIKSSWKKINKQRFLDKGMI